jgi:hypothetical protein
MVYAELFDNDLDSISRRLNNAALKSFFPGATTE